MYCPQLSGFQRRCLFYPYRNRLQQRKMDSTFCGGCGGRVGRVHQCPECKCAMHPFYGTPVGPGGFGQPIRCPRCSEGQSSITVGSTHTAQKASEAIKRASKSPIADAFARARIQVTASAKTKMVDNCAKYALESQPARPVPSSPALTVAAPSNRSVELITRSSSRASAQVVTTLAQRRKVLHWMLKTVEVHG